MDRWLEIKTEYITTDTSYRKLAEKYQVNYQVIAKVGRSEGWGELRKQHTNKTFTKTVEKISNQQARRAARVDALADKLLIKLEKAIDELDGHEKMQVDYKGLRQLTQALQQLQEIKGEKPELDRQEQEARIANLRKQADKDEDKDRCITVRLEGGLEDYAQ